MDTVPKRPNPAIDDFERHLVRNSADCAKVLGCAYSTYMEYRSGKELPRAVANHIDVIFRLPLDRLHVLIQERLG